MPDSGKRAQNRPDMHNQPDMQDRPGAWLAEGEAANRSEQQLAQALLWVICGLVAGGLGFLLLDILTRTLPGTPGSGA